MWLHRVRVHVGVAKQGQSTHGYTKSEYTLVWLHRVRVHNYMGGVTQSQCTCGQGYVRMHMGVGEVTQGQNTPTHGCGYTGSEYSQYVPD